MKMSTVTFKGVGAAFVVWLTYLNDTFSPLFWVLLGLICLDLVLNIHKEGQQFAKLGSAFASLGIPSFIGNGIGHPGFEKYLVAVMALAYLQIVVPQLLNEISKLYVRKAPTPQQVADLALVDTIVQQVAAKLEAQAQAQAAAYQKENVGQVVPGPDTTIRGAQ